MVIRGGVRFGPFWISAPLTRQKSAKERSRDRTVFWAIILPLGILIGVAIATYGLVLIPLAVVYVIWRRRINRFLRAWWKAAMK
jgi:hypothetical protein